MKAVDFSSTLTHSEKESSQKDYFALLGELKEAVDVALHESKLASDWATYALRDVDDAMLKTEEFFITKSDVEFLHAFHQEYPGRSIAQVLCLRENVTAEDGLRWIAEVQVEEIRNKLDASARRSKGSDPK